MPIEHSSHRHPRHVIVIASGGLDSTVLAYLLAARGAELTLLSFDYGQRHRVELEHAADISTLLGCPQEIVNLSFPPNRGGLLYAARLAAVVS